MIDLTKRRTKLFIRFLKEDSGIYKYLQVYLREQRGYNIKYNVLLRSIVHETGRRWANEMRKITDIPHMSHEVPTISLLDYIFKMSALQDDVRRHLLTHTLKKAIEFDEKNDLIKENF